MQDSVRAAFDEHLEATRDEPVYVILGVQGSGTNLLCRLLVRIFNFSMMLDRSLVYNAGARLGASPTQEAIAREIQHVTSHIFPGTLTRKLSKYAIRDNEPFVGLGHVLDPGGIHSGADLARRVYSYRAFAKKTRLMGIKSDDIWETIGAIDEVLPNRRIVLITRDFRDNLVSITGKAFGPVEPLRAASYVKERLTPYAAEYRRAGDSAFHVDFAALVNSPRQVIDRLAQHFALTPAVDPDTVITKFRFRQGKIEKWRALRPDQLAWCEGILYDELVEFGYTPVTASRTIPDGTVRAEAVVRDIIGRVPQKVRHLAGRFKR